MHDGRRFLRFFVVVGVIVVVVVVGCRGAYPERKFAHTLASMRGYAAHRKGACGIGPSKLDGSVQVMSGVMVLSRVVIWPTLPSYLATVS